MNSFNECLFFFPRTGSCLNLFRVAIVCTEAYLTQAATGSTSANLELLPSSHHFTCTYASMLPTSNINCPLGPCVPAVMTCCGCPSPSSPGFTPTADQHLHNPQGTHPPSHGPCVTLTLPYYPHTMLIPPPNTIITFSRHPCNTRVTP